MKIGLAQMNIIWEEIEENKQKAEEFCRQARQRGVDILVFPEMTLTGFSMNVAKTTRDWEGQKAFFCRLSAQYELTIVFGYPARQGEKYYNHLGIAAEGKEQMDYIKIHPFSYGEESRYFEGGYRIERMPYQDTVLGGFICYDLRFPEVFQMSSASSEIIFVIANWPETRIDHWDVLLPARAIENQCYIVAVNRTGEGGGLSYNGHSAVYAPTGERKNVLSEKEELLLVEFDPKEVQICREQFPTKKDRREELYRFND